VVEPYIRTRRSATLRKAQSSSCRGERATRSFEPITAAALREPNRREWSSGDQGRRIYTADPKLRPDAKRYDKLSFEEAMVKI